MRDIFEDIPFNADVIYLGWMRAGISWKGSNLVHIDDPPTATNQDNFLKRHPVCLHGYVLLNGGRNLRRIIHDPRQLFDNADVILAALSANGILKSFAINGASYPSTIEVATRPNIGNDPGKNTNVCRRRGRNHGIVFQSCNGADMNQQASTETHCHPHWH